MVMYKVININTGKVFFGLFGAQKLTDCLNMLRNKLGMQATVKQAYEAGYRIVRA